MKCMRAKNKKLIYFLSFMIKNIDKKMPTSKDEIIEIVKKASNQLTRIIPTVEIKEKYIELDWGGNGVGDRFANKAFNYSIIYGNKKTRLYSESEMQDEVVPSQLLSDFLERNRGSGSQCIGIFIHSLRTNIQTRPIEKKIHKTITSLSCVICGTPKTICDHKNDLYNDPRVLDSKTQRMDDFQSLCNHCNLQKRAVCVSETNNQRIYSAKNIPRYRIYLFEFPWEKKAFDKTDIYCKNDTYWFDPVEFDRKIYYYISYTIPIIREIKRKIIVIS